MRKDSDFARGVKLCAAVSGVLMAGFFTAHHFTQNHVLLSLAITMLTIFYHFAMRLVIGFAVPKLSAKVDPNTRLLAAGKKELSLYKKLGLKKYKDKIPTYAPDLFDAKQHTLREIAFEMCRAEIVHLVIIPLSFVPLALIPLWGAAAVFIITSVLAAAAECVFVVLQRYNLARIQPLLRREKQH